MSLLVRTVHSVICCAGQEDEEEAEEEEEGDQGLLGERVNTPEASSMVFLRAVSLATLWLSRLRRSWRQNFEVKLLLVLFCCNQLGLGGDYFFITSYPP